jgi:hypothetical protein
MQIVDCDVPRRLKQFHLSPLRLCVRTQASEAPQGCEVIATPNYKKGETKQ